MGHLLALVAIVQLLIGFFVGTSHVIAAQCFFLLAVFAATVGVAIEMKAKTLSVTKGRS